MLDLDNILLDTSSVLFGLRYRKSAVDAVISKFGVKPTVSIGVLSELKGFSRGIGSKAPLARFALLELKAKKINVDNITTNPDKWMLDSASRKRGRKMVTNDTALARKLRAKGAEVFKMSKSGILRRFNL